MRVIALLRGLMVAPARGSTAGPGGGRRGAKTAGATPTTGCVTPPGGVGVERSRDILLIVAPSLRNDHDLQIVGKIPRFGRVTPKAERRKASRVDLSASLHSHTTWGGDAAGGCVHRHSMGGLPEGFSYANLGAWGPRRGHHGAT